MKTELETIYQITSQKRNDSLVIEDFEILNSKIVDYDYSQKIKINSLEFIIGLKKKVIENNKQNILLLERNINNRNELIRLNESNKEEYLKDIEYDQRRLEKANNDIEKLEDEIAILSQEVVLTQAEFGQNQDQLFLINYIFKGKINNENRLDTLSVLRSNNSNYQFIKNEKYSDYKGM
jgi:hypothetical protein